MRKMVLLATWCVVSVALVFWLKGDGVSWHPYTRGMIYAGWFYGALAAWIAGSFVAWRWWRVLTITAIRGVWRMGEFWRALLSEAEDRGRRR